MTTTARSLCFYGNQRPDDAATTRPPRLVPTTTVIQISRRALRSVQSETVCARARAPIEAALLSRRCSKHNAPTQRSCALAAGHCWCRVMRTRRRTAALHAYTHHTHLIILEHENRETHEACAWFNGRACLNNAAMVYTKHKTNTRIRVCKSRTTGMQTNAGRVRVSVFVWNGESQERACFMLYVLTTCSWYSEI